MNTAEIVEKTLNILNKTLEAAGEEMDKLRAKNAKLREALESIDTWAKAYPLNIFPKPDLKKAAQVLKDAGITLDAISADAMRNVLDGVKDIVSEALKRSDADDGTAPVSGE